MRIAQIAPLAESVPPILYGGTERVVSWLAEELVQRGHEVSLFASGDSRTRARLEASVPRALRLAGVQDHLPFHLLALDEVFRRAGEFDIIHSHIDYLAFPFTRFTSTPVVHTLHGRLDLPSYPELFQRFSDVRLVSISDAQRLPVRAAPFVTTVRHGMPVDLFPFVPDAEDYVVFLGRISPEKDPVAAIEAAKLAGTRLVIAAKVDPVDREFFEQKVRPLLDHPLIEFVGEVCDRDKPRVLGRAKALLLPIDWPEPFGIVFIEALAHGTPVITRRHGSVPEIIRPGVTGLLASTVQELARAINEVDKLDRADCRADFEHRFSVGRMAREYEELYARLLTESLDSVDAEGEAVA